MIYGIRARKNKYEIVQVRYGLDVPLRKFDNIDDAFKYLDEMRSQYKKDIKEKISN